MNKDISNQPELHPIEQELWEENARKQKKSRVAIIDGPHAGLEFSLPNGVDFVEIENVTSTLSTTYYRLSQNSLKFSVEQINE